MKPEASLPHSQVPAICPYPEPALSSPKPTFYFLKIHLIIIISHLHRGLPRGLFSSGFHTKTQYTPLLSPISATCSAHLILLNFITRKLLSEQYRSQSCSCNFLHSLVTSSFLDTNILLNTLFSNTLCLPTILSQRQRPTSHLHKTTGKIIIMYILIFIFLDIKLEE